MSNPEAKQVARKAIQATAVDLVGEAKRLRAAQVEANQDLTAAREQLREVEQRHATTTRQLEAQVDALFEVMSANGLECDGNEGQLDVELGYQPQHGPFSTAHGQWVATHLRRRAVEAADQA